jgi:hypothetical protein
MLGYIHQILGLSIYLEAISNGMLSLLSMLSMLSWSKYRSWRREEKEDKTPSDEPTVPQLSVGAIVGRVSAQGETLGTVRWTDSPFFSSVGRVAEEEQRRQ